MSRDAKNLNDGLDENAGDMVASAGSTIDGDIGAAKRQLRTAIKLAKESGVDVPALLSKLGVNVSNDSGSLDFEGLMKLYSENQLPKEFIDELSASKVVKGADGRTINFRKQIIPASDIESLTKVAPINPRGVDGVTESDVQDIVSTLDEREQDKPAYGYLKDGVILISEGQRRRLALIVHARKGKNVRDFKVWVTEDRLTLADIKILDEVEEAKLARSPIQQGRYWLMLWNEEFGEDKVDYYRLSSYLDKSYDTVKTYCGFAKLDNNLIKLAIYPASISVRQIKILRTLNSKFSLDKLQVTREQLFKKSEDELAKMSITEANRVFVNNLVKVANETLGEATENKTSPSKYVAIESCDLNNGLGLSSRRSNEKGKTCSFEYKIDNFPTNIDEATLERIHSRLSQVLNEELTSS